MTVEKTANLIVALGINDPEHRLRAKEHIRKIAQRRIEYGNLTKGTKITHVNLTKGTKLKHADLHTEHEHKVWGTHVDEIVNKHRKMFGEKNEHIPYPLPAGTKYTATKLFRQQYEGDVKATVEKMKKKGGIDEDDISKGTGLNKGRISKETCIDEDDISKGSGLKKGNISRGKGLSKTNISKK